MRQAQVIASTGIKTAEICKLQTAVEIKLICLCKDLYRHLLLTYNVEASINFDHLYINTSVL